MNTDRSAPFQSFLIPKAGFSRLHIAHHILQVAMSVRRWVAAVDLVRRLDPPVEFSHAGAVYPCVSVSSSEGLDARDGTMSRLEDYNAIFTARSSRGRLRSAPRSKSPAVFLKRPQFAWRMLKRGVRCGRGARRIATSRTMPKWSLVRVGWSDQAGAGARREEANAKSSLPCLMHVGLRTSFRRWTCSELLKDAYIYRSAILEGHDEPSHGWWELKSPAASTISVAARPNSSSNSRSAVGG